METRDYSKIPQLSEESPLLNGVFTRRRILAALVLTAGGSLFFQRRDVPLTPEQRYQKLIELAQEKERKMADVLAFIHGPFIRSLQGLKTGNQELQTIIQETIAILQTPAPSGLSKNSYTTALKALETGKEFLLPALAEGEIQTPEDVMRHIQYNHPRVLEPPFVRYLFSRPGIIEPASYTVKNGFLTIAEHFSGETLMEKIMLLHELRHVGQFQKILQRLPPKERKNFTENLGSRLSEAGLNVLLIDLEEDAVAASLEIADLTVNGNLRRGVRTSPQIIDTQLGFPAYPPIVRRNFFENLDALFWQPEEYPENKKHIRPILERCPEIKITSDELIRIPSRDIVEYVRRKKSP